MADQNLRSNYDVYLGDDGIIYDEIEKIERNNETAIEMAQMEHQSVQKILLEHPREKYPLLVDLTKVSKKANIGAGAREVYQALLAEPQIVKVAFVGSSLILKVLVKILAKAAGMGHQSRWFSDREKAIRWLLEISSV